MLDRLDKAFFVLSCCLSAFLKIDLRYALVIDCMQIKNYLMNGWNINVKGLEKKMGCRYNEN